MDQKPEDISPERDECDNDSLEKVESKGSKLLEYSTDLGHMMRKAGQKKQAKLYSTGFPTPLLLNDLHARSTYYKIIKKKCYNWAICGFGIENFMSYAAYFCKNEALNGAVEIISVGSGDGTVDNSIIEAYQAHFGTALNITLVDINPKFEVDYRTVVELIEKRPDVVKNCVLLIMWPEPHKGKPESDRQADDVDYDIDSIRKLQPRAVLTAYEPTGISGSWDFAEFLSEGNKHWEFYGEKYDAKDYGLDKYTVEEVAYQEVHIEANEKVEIFGNEEYTSPPGVTGYRLRIVKLKRTD